MSDQANAGPSRSGRVGMPGAVLWVLQKAVGAESKAPAFSEPASNRAPLRNAQCTSAMVALTLMA
eukprot:7405421-Lingulodinium_polyedra.AAC.1